MSAGAGRRRTSIKTYGRIDSEWEATLRVKYSALTMRELLNKLAEREQVKLEAKLEADHRIREMENQITNECGELLEMTRKHEQDMKVMKARCDKKTRDAVLAWDQEIRQARQEATRLAADADFADRRRDAAEAHVRRLSLEVESHLRESARVREEICRFDQQIRAQDERVRRVNEQAKERTEKMSRYVAEVSMQSDNALGIFENQVLDHFRRANIRTEERRHISNLCDLSRAAGNYEMSKEAEQEMRTALQQVWTLQKGEVKQESKATSKSGMRFQSMMKSNQEGMLGEKVGKQESLARMAARVQRMC